MTVPDLDCAIREANNTRYGLGASIWTKDLTTAKRVFDEVRAGIIWVNRHLTVPPEVPFGGMNDSGIGRENGQHALDSAIRRPKPCSWAGKNIIVFSGISQNQSAPLQRQSWQAGAEISA